MLIVAHGIDVINLPTFEQIAGDVDTDFIERCFTALEKSQFVGAHDQLEHLAGRFAAKEAIAKALGTGFDGEVSPLNIEIRNQASGVPEVQLTGGAARAATRIGAESWLLSIAHMRPTVIASAIGLGT